MKSLCFSVLLLVAQVSTPQCGESSSLPAPSSTAAFNVVPIGVNAGPTNDAINQPFVCVIICVPGTSNCQTIGGILIDTASTGLRILSSAVTLPLPQQNGAGGAPVVECLPFVDGFTWGPVQTADVKLAGEQASAIAIQMIGTDRFGTIPSGCSSKGTAENTQSDLNANGILGVGMFRQDCGSGCTFTGSSNPGLYYTCPTAATCQVTTEPLANQVSNPVASFAGDNNGVVMQLPAVPTGGAPSITGSLIFGIGTQSNNQLPSGATPMTLACDAFTTIFNGQNFGFTNAGACTGLTVLSTAARTQSISLTSQIFQHAPR